MRSWTFDAVSAARHRVREDERHSHQLVLRHAGAVDGREVAVARPVPENQDVTALQASLRVRRLAEHDGGRTVDGRLADTSRRPLRHERPAASHRDSHESCRNAERRIDLPPIGSECVLLATDEQMEDVGRSIVEAVERIQEVGVWSERKPLELRDVARLGCRPARRTQQREPDPTSSGATRSRDRRRCRAQRDR
jgi:hypothetical protein